MRKKTRQEGRFDDDVFIRINLFLYQVEANCHGLCSYEHREQQISELLTHALRKRLCSLKDLPKILHCAYRDNRKCCQNFGIGKMNE